MLIFFLVCSINNKILLGKISSGKFVTSSFIILNEGIALQEIPSLHQLTHNIDRCFINLCFC